MKKIISMVLALVMVMGLSVTAMAEGPEESIKSSDTVVIKDFSQTNPNTTEIQIPAKFSETKPADNDKVTARNYVYMEWSVDSTLKYVIDSSSYTWNVYNDAKGQSAIPADGSANTKPLSAGYSVKGHWDKTTSATINVTVENWSNRDVWVKYTLDGAGVSTTKDTAGKVTGVTEPIEFQNVTLPETQKLDTVANVNSTELVTAVNKATPDAIVITGANIASGAINKDVTSIGTLTVTISNTVLQ